MSETHCGNLKWGERLPKILTLWFLKVEKLGNTCRSAVGPLCYGHSKVLIRFTAIGLGPVDWGVDLKTDIEFLAREEVLLVRWDDAAERWTRAQTLEVLGRDRRERSRRDGEQLEVRPHPELVRLGDVASGCPGAKLGGGRYRHQACSRPILGALSRRTGGPFPLYT